MYDLLINIVFVATSPLVLAHLFAPSHAGDVVPIRWGTMSYIGALLIWAVFVWVT